MNDSADQSPECAVARAHPLGDVAFVLGEGPVYPWGTGTITLSDLPRLSDGQYRFKVVWIVDTQRHAGEIIVRGSATIGEGQVGFATEAEGEADSELHLGETSSHLDGNLSEYGSYVEVPGRGCYAYDISGPGLSQRVVFRVVP